MFARLAIVIGILFLILLMSYDETEAETENESVSWANVESVSDCDMQYKEASDEQRNSNGQTYTINYSMDADGFFDKCAEGNMGPWSKPCPYYQQCIASVKNKLPGTVDIEPLSYAATAEYVRDYLIKQNELKNTAESANSRSDNILKACSNPHERGKALNGMIYRYIPEVPDLDVAERLALKANSGYGECICVLHDYLNLDIDMSIGKCLADQFISY